MEKTMTLQSHNRPHKHQLMFVCVYVCVYVYVYVYVCVCMCYRIFVCAVFIRLGSTDRQVSIENNVSQGINQWLIVDDEENL